MKLYRRQFLKLAGAIATGGEPLPGSPAVFAKLIAEETEKWGQVIRADGVKPE